MKLNPINKSQNFNTIYNIRFGKNFFYSLKKSNKNLADFQGVKTPAKRSFNENLKASLINLRRKQILKKSETVLKDAKRLLEVSNAIYSSDLNVILNAKSAGFKSSGAKKSLHVFKQNDDKTFNMYEFDNNILIKVTKFNPDNLKISKITYTGGYSDGFSVDDKVLSFKDGKLQKYMEKVSQDETGMRIGALFEFSDGELTEYSKNINKNGKELHVKNTMYFLNDKLTDCKINSSTDNSGLYIKEWFTFENGKLTEYMKDAMPFSMDFSSHYMLNDEGMLVEEKYF